jgi:hypothetical protein
VSASRSDGSTYLAAPSGSLASVTKLDPGGTPEWTRTIESTGLTQIAPASNGGVVATGPTGGGPARALGFLLTEIDRAGSTQWSVQIPSQHAYPTGLAATADGFVAIGSSSDAATDFDPGPATQLPLNLPTSFITRYAFERQSAARRELPDAPGRDIRLRQGPPKPETTALISWALLVRCRASGASLGTGRRSSRVAPAPG